jgi:hypothetical protein
VCVGSRRLGNVPKILNLRISPRGSLHTSLLDTDSEMVRPSMQTYSSYRLACFLVYLETLLQLRRSKLSG